MNEYKMEVSCGLDGDESRQTVLAERIYQIKLDFETKTTEAICIQKKG
jgi:hypothetical protein